MYISINEQQQKGFAFYDFDHILSFFLSFLGSGRQTGKTLRLGTLTSIFYGAGKEEHMLLGTLWLCNVCKTVTGDAVDCTAPTSSGRPLHTVSFD